MEPGAPLTPVPLDQHGCVAADIPCVRCAYNLRGLPAGQGCPECGRAIALSLRGDALEFRYPPWVARLARGAAWMLTGFGGYLVMGNVGFPLLAALGWWGINGGLLAFAGLAIAGIWQVTSPDPGRPTSLSHTDPRWLARTLLVSGICLACLMYLVREAGNAWGSRMPGFAAALPKVQLTAGVPASVCVFGCLGFLLVHMRGIVLEGPSPRLARQVRILLWVLAAGVGVTMVVDVVQGIWPRTTIMVGPSANWIAQWVGMFRWLGNVLLIIYFLWFVVLLIGYTVVLRRMARLARTNWNIGTIAGTRADLPASGA